MHIYLRKLYNAGGVLLTEADVSGAERLSEWIAQNGVYDEETGEQLPFYDSQIVMGKVEAHLELIVGEEDPL